MKPATEVAKNFVPCECHADPAPASAPAISTPSTPSYCEAADPQFWLLLIRCTLGGKAALASLALLVAKV